MGHFTAGQTHLGFPEEELQVSAAQDAVVLDVAREVHGAGTVHGAMDLHVAVDGVQVLLFVLEQTGRNIQFMYGLFFMKRGPQTKVLLKTTIFLSPFWEDKFLSKWDAPLKKRHLLLQHTDKLKWI